jgi:hypothetical protein
MHQLPVSGRLHVQAITRTKSTMWIDSDETQKCKYLTLLGLNSDPSDAQPSEITYFVQFQHDIVLYFRSFIQYQLTYKGTAVTIYHPLQHFKKLHTESIVYVRILKSINTCFATCYEQTGVCFQVGKTKN